MKIRTLLVGGFALLCALMIALVVIAQVQFDLIEGHTSNILRANGNVSLARDVQDRINAIRRFQLNSVANSGESAVELDRASKSSRESVQLADELEKRQRHPDTKELTGTIHKLAEQYARSHEEIVARSKEQQPDVVRQLVNGEARSIQRTAMKATEDFVEIQKERQKRAEIGAQEAHAFAARMMYVLLALAIVLASAVAALVTRRITGQLGGEPEVARQLVQRIAEGDLSQDLHVAAADRQSLMAHQQQMQLKLRAMLQNVSSAVGSTERAAQGLAGSSQQVAAASRHASESATSMAAVVEEMSVSISQVSDNARDALQTATRAAELADSGGSVIEKATSEITDIAETVKRTSGAMSLLDESSAKISSVVGVIKEVADQTNLLALNAAIEAARAGESGRGFAVVADEVRKLAERTGKATSEINTMVVKIQEETRHSLALMETAVQQVDRGVELAGSAGTAIRSIRGSVEQMVAVVNDIGSAIAEQSVASQQIAQRVEQVAQASEENNAAAQQTAEAAATLSSLAGGLRQTVAQFRT